MMRSRKGNTVAKAANTPARQQRATRKATKWVIGESLGPNGPRNCCKWWEVEKKDVQYDQSMITKYAKYYNVLEIAQTN